MFVVYVVDLSPVKTGPEMAKWIIAIGEEVEDPVRCRFLVTRSAEKRFRTMYLVREVLGLPSLVTYTEEQLEPSTVGQWEIDEVVPQSKGRGTKAIAGVLRFTGDETVFAPLRIEGHPCELTAVKGNLALPLASGLASKPAVSDRGFPMPGRGHCVRGDQEDRRTILRLAYRTTRMTGAR